MDEKTATRDRILAAAIERFKHYGYGKTTMAEIAGDSGMSPGNIYRFFESKIDIAEAMARRHYGDELTPVFAIARQKGLSVEQRLHDMLLARMRFNFKLAEGHARMAEIGGVLATERPLFVAELVAQERAVLSALIEEGIAGGVFAPADANAAAETIQAAVFKFAMPQVSLHSTLPRLEREYEGVMALLLAGLRAGVGTALRAKP